MKEGEMGELNLNLNPMMDMFAVLIPALLMMSVVVEVASVDVAAPPERPNDDVTPPPEPAPLNLTVTIAENGYLVYAHGTKLAADGRPLAEGAAPSLPLVE